MSLDKLQRDAWSHQEADRLLKQLLLCGGDRTAGFGHLRAALYHAVERGKRLERKKKARER